MVWAVKLKKNVPFLGREALTKLAAKKLPKLLACFTVDDPSIVLLGRETIFRNGKQCGWLASGGYGYTLETNIGIGYVRDKENGVNPETCSAARTSWRSPASATRPRSAWSRSTIRRWRASRRSCGPRRSGL
jgi:glycine cleavage system aminomethyltransferase T